MHPVSGRRIFGCFGSNFALTGVSGALSGVCQSSPKVPSFPAETPFDFVGGAVKALAPDFKIFSFIKIYCACVF